MENFVRFSNETESGNIVAAMSLARMTSAALLPQCFLTDWPPLHCCRDASFRNGRRCIVTAMFPAELASAALLPRCFLPDWSPLHCCHDVSYRISSRCIVAAMFLATYSISKPQADYLKPAVRFRG
jgi:hypothetical protein